MTKARPKARPHGARRDARADAKTYEVVLRRDAQQVVRVHVEALSRQEAIDVAESVVDESAWRVEEHIGSHKPEVKEGVKG